MQLLNRLSELAFLISVRQQITLDLAARRLRHLRNRDDVTDDDTDVFVDSLAHRFNGRHKRSQLAAIKNERDYVIRRGVVRPHATYCNFAKLDAGIFLDYRFEILR